MPRLGPGVRLALPFAAVAAPFGVSFGLAARDAGMGPVAPVVMSVTTFAGSAQFAVAQVLGDGGGAVAACLAAVLLNARYLAVGISVAPVMGGPWWRRLAEAQLVVDESWAIAHLGGGRFDRGRLVGAGLTLMVAWVAGTVVGAAGGAWLGDPADLGLDGALAALFLALVAGQRRERWAVPVAVAGAAVALALVPVAAPGVPVIAAGLVAVAGVWRR
jgi:4-azaleucine resistance transporter AzlC